MGVEHQEPALRRDLKVASTSPSPLERRLQFGVPSLARACGVIQSWLAGDDERFGTAAMSTCRFSNTTHDMHTWGTASARTK
jgi:hypothetical protein